MTLHSCNDRFPPIADIGEARHTSEMKLRSLLSLLLPYRRTTERKARQALLDCGISPDTIAWKVGDDGVFAFGRKEPDAKTPSEEQLQCVLDWTRRERIKVGIIAWERDAD